MEFWSSVSLHKVTESFALCEIIELSRHLQDLEGEPECVLYCAPGALEYREVTSSVDFKKKSFAEKIRQAYAEV